VRTVLANIVMAFTLLHCQSGYSCTALFVTDAWIREPPPMAKIAAGYFAIENLSDRELTVTALSSNCCERIEMHRTILTGDRASMSPIDELTIPPHDTVKFSPGGSHLMLIHPRIAMGQGKLVDIEFQCVDGAVSQTSFEIVTVR
jgi:copper(I)-binding protein